jgi:hypothetical protein
MKKETDDRDDVELGAMHLENILIMTGEMDHLAALLRHRAQEMEGVKAAEMMQDVIHPLLDELEAELRDKAPEKPGIEDLRGIVAAWIDRKMAEPSGS